MFLKSEGKRRCNPSPKMCPGDERSAKAWRQDERPESVYFKVDDPHSTPCWKIHRKEPLKRDRISWVRGREPSSSIRKPFREDRELSLVIEDSRTILELKDDFDGEGSAGYKRETWEHAVEFIRNCARHLWETDHVIIDIPDIQPGPHGSIDIHWETEDYELLLNIPMNKRENITYYGDNYSDVKVKGSFSSNGNGSELLCKLLSCLGKK
jgi:hypothetical protein